MGEFDYEREVKVKSGLPDEQRMAGEIGRIRDAASRGKGRTEGHGEGRDEGTRDREGSRTMTGMVAILPGWLEWKRNAVQPVLGQGRCHGPS